MHPSGFVRLRVLSAPWIFALAATPLVADVSDAQQEPEQGAPQVVATAPGPGDETVSILVEPTVYYDRALDPATVRPDSLILLAGDGAQVEGRVVLGADGRSVAFVPARPLDYASDYALQIAAATDRGDEVVVFSTYANPPQRHLFYWGPYLQSYLAYEVDDLGRILATAAVVSPGFDGEWFTEDDAVAWRERSSYDPAGRLRATAHYISAGPDGEWRTDDDVIDWRRLWIPDAPDRVVRISYDGPGFDGEWLVEDDRIAAVSVIVYDRRGRPIQRRSYGYPGGDGTWFTDDDVLAYVLEFEYAGDALIAWRRVIGPGADGEWEGGDQRLAYRARRTLDAVGHRDLTIVYTYAGGDGEWGTDDDVIGYVIDADVSPAGLLQRRIIYAGPGVDGEWFAENDEVASYVLYEYDEQQLQTAIVAFNHPGNDLEWFTEDDLPVALSATAYDPLGNRIMRLVLSDAGLHDVWQFTDRPPYTAVEALDEL